MPAPDPTLTNNPDPLTVTGADPATRSGAATASAGSTGTSEESTLTDGPPVSPQRYILGAEIARGGMGAVYRATDTVLAREVAVKVLQEKYGPESAAARRFTDEARITGQLQHPAIPPVHDLGRLADGRPFLAMKLIKGDTLDELLKARAELSADRGRFIAAFESICQAVAYAHAHQVIHRDLKPSNVMVGAFGEVQVMDWGLAKVLGEQSAEKSDPNATAAETEIRSLRDSDGTFTQAGSILGTPAFMPPEQALGTIGKIDTRSDVFGLGAILAVILTGKPPFVAGSAETTRVKAAQGKLQECFDSLSTCGADPELVALCQRCLAPEKSDRPVDASEVAAAVASLRMAAEERARQAELDKVRAEGDKAIAEASAVESRKRRRIQAIGVGILILGVTAFNVVEWRNAEKIREEQAFTKAARALAEDRLEQVVDTWYVQLITVQNELDQQAVSAEFRRRVLLTAKERLGAVLRDRPRTRVTDHMLHVLHRRLAEAQWQSGDPNAGQLECDEAQRIAELRFQEDPDGPDSQRDMADSWFTRSDIAAAKGDWPAALVGVIEAEKYLTAHLARYPDDRRGKEDQIRLMISRGQLLARLNRAKESQTVFVEAVRQAQNESESHPDDLRASGLLLTSLQGASLVVEPAQALGYLTSSLKLLEKQQQADPKNRRWIANRALVFNLLAELELKRNRPAEARRWFEQALAIRLKIASEPSITPDVLHDLAFVYQRIGDVSYSTSEYSRAAVEFAEAIRIQEGLLVTLPTSAERAALGVMLARLAAVKLQLGDVVASRSLLMRSLELRKIVASEQPQDHETQYALAETYRILGDVAMHSTVLDFPKAVEHYAEAERLLKTLQAHGKLDESRPERRALLRDSAWGAAYCRRIVEVLTDPDKANSYPPEEAFPLLIARMRVQAKAGDARGAAETGDLVRALNPNHGAYLAGAARGYALAVKAAKNPADIARYIGKTRELLNAAKTLNADVRSLANDPDFAAFRLAIAPPIPPATR